MEKQVVRHGAGLRPLAAAVQVYLGGRLRMDGLTGRGQLDGLTGRGQRNSVPHMPQPALLPMPQVSPGSTSQAWWPLLTVCNMAPLALTPRTLSSP